MRYEPDLSRIPLSVYRDLLQGQALLPSRQLLRQALDARFAALAALGITQVARLREALSTPAKLAATAEKSGIPAQYLNLLRREAGSLLAKPVPLAAFPGVDCDLLDTLQKRGITTSKAYFEQAQDCRGTLYCLCDLVRINGVGPGAARMLYDAGFHTPAELAVMDAETLLTRIAADNAAHRYYRGTLGLKDMRFCIAMAKLLSL